MRKSYYELSVTRFPSKYRHKNIIVEMKLILRKYNVGNPVLDLGCGDGVRTRLILGDSIEVYGVDKDPQMLEFAKKRLNEVYLGDIEDLPEDIGKRKFNTILLMESLEHVSNPAKVLSKARELLAANGLLVIVIPLETPLFRLIWWIWTRTMGKRWKDAHIYRFKSPENLFSLLENQFRVVEFRRTNLGCILIVVCRKMDEGE